MRGAALIVLAWNQWSLTRRCLDSLLASTLDSAHVIVVDNGSNDETPHALRDYADRVRIVTLPENLGFVRGMNAGIAAARPDDDVVLLNNDLLFTQADWLGRLRDVAYAAPDIGIVGCRLLGPEAEPLLYHAGGFIEPHDLWGQQTESGRVEGDVGQYTGTRRVQGIAFALAYIRRDCLNRIGALDPAFHSYFEDTDYCLRAADAGIATVVAGAVTLRHDQHGSTADDDGFRQRLWQASRVTFAARWQQRLRADYRGNVLWQGSTRFPSAQAHLARSLLRRLDARGLRMAFGTLGEEVPDTKDFRLDLALRRRWPGVPDIGLVCAPGAHFAQALGRRRVALGFGQWQRVPPDWAAAAQTLDLLLVPDEFQREAFRAAGVRVPIELLPLGVDRDYCHPGVPAPRRARNAFVFLAVVEELARDAPDVLLGAFTRAFAADDGVELVIHIRPGRDAEAIAAALAPALVAAPHVRVLAGWGLHWYQRTRLLAAVDACVCAGRGGGWDPLAGEALACAKPLIATAFGSGASRVREYGFAVEPRAWVRDPAQSTECWAEPDAEALAQQFRNVHAQRETLAATATAAARATAFARRHDIEDSADRLAGFLARDAALAPARARAAPHRPVSGTRTASGQLVVLGMHRSGTSSVAGLLVQLGAHAGPADDLLVGPDNPKGHFESGRLHAACVRRLAAAGGDWRHPPREAPAAAIDAFRREVGALIDELDARRPWLIKDPRLCLLARELLPLLTRPVFVHVVRDPHAVAASLASRDAMPGHDAFALWERYTRAAFAASRGWPRVLVDYVQLTADPLGSAQRLHDQLRAFGIEGLVAPDAERVRAWIELPRPRARDAAIELGASQRALLDAIDDRRILDDADAFDLDAAGASPSPRSTD